MLRYSLLGLACVAVIGCQTTRPQVAEMALKPAIENATMAYQQGDLQLAEGLWRQLLERDPSLLVAWCHLGHIGFRQHAYQASLSAYQKCLRYQPQQPEIWHNMAVIKLRQASELLIQGSAYLPVEEGDSHTTQTYPRLLKALMQLQRVAQTTEQE